MSVPGCNPRWLLQKWLHEAFSGLPLTRWITTCILKVSIELSNSNSLKSGSLKAEATASALFCKCLCCTYCFLSSSFSPVLRSASCSAVSSKTQLHVSLPMKSNSKKGVNVSVVKTAQRFEFSVICFLFPTQSRLANAETLQIGPFSRIFHRLGSSVSLDAIFTSFLAISAWFGFVTSRIQCMLVC